MTVISVPLFRNEKFRDFPMIFPVVFIKFPGVILIYLQWPHISFDSLPPCQVVGIWI